MHKLKDLLPNRLKTNSSTKCVKSNGTIEKEVVEDELVRRTKKISVGRLETDAQPMNDDEENNGNNNAISPIASPTASTELTESVVRELQNPNYNSATGALMESSENFGLAMPGAMNNTMNVHNNQQQNVVMQFSNASNLHFGSVYNFNGNMGASSVATDLAATNDLKKGNLNSDGKRFAPRKTTTIVAMMQSLEEPNTRMLDTISTHLGEGWKQVMRDLGQSEGQIEQALIDHQMHGGIKEVIYQLLLQWIRGADDNTATLGYITTLLWEGNHRDCVKRMKLVWKSETNRKTSS